MHDPNDEPLGGRDAWVETDTFVPVEAAPRAPDPRPDPVGAAIVAHPPRATFLVGEDGPMPGRGPLAMLDALLRRPANLLHELTTRPRAHLSLFAIMLALMATAGLFVGAFSGGYQLLAVPLKLSLGMTACALICLPSLYIFASLSGGEHGLRATAGSLLLGVTLTSLLLVGFAPVVWVFSQATDSSAFIGALHLLFFFVSAHFGLRLTRRALANIGGRPVPALWLWSLVFVMVALQMSTTLRPLVGPFEGALVADKEFFLVHWFS